ncbi:MAG: undecaprenyldiphospho-muramoylpentapeptide beta-N-acetylglucosaminyltransferase, partial [Deltaproteobacteria bacterium]|nr:undecaprenyldiphospho-muramoylpentapeptide beta-N-acetylglucosaminyltransferase [Deltaproteobacteria bacterium]
MKLIVAGGGTGGHLFSGLAVAEEWVSRGFEVLFVGTPKGLEKDLVPRFGYRLELINVLSLKGSGFFLKLKTLAGVPRALVKSRRLLKKEKPDLVLGIGGYASGPMVVAAKLKGIPTAVIDQNSVPGLTNRWLGKWVDRVFLMFEESASWFGPEKVRITGNPVLKKLKKEALGQGNPRDILLICGGSQGAHAINEKFIQVVGDIRQKYPDLKIVHQTGAADYEWVSKEMREKRIEAVVAPFFDNLQDYYRRAKLVVARAGAGTLTELALFGVPSILIPYPFAADEHQKKNADIFVRHGGAEMILQRDLTPHGLAEKIEAFLTDPERLKEMSRKARSLAKPDAAKKIVDELMFLAKAVQIPPSLEGRGSG